MSRARIKSRSVLALLLVIAFANITPAQDAHYWTDQFGNRARLLGGAVVGSVRDLSATYYNPGSLALVPTAELLLAGNVLSYTRYDATTGPQQQKLSSSTFGLSPSLFAGEVPKKVAGNNRVAYSFMTRQETEFRLQGRGSIAGSDFDLPNLNVLADNLQAEQDMSEHWFGVTYSRRATAHVGFGVTTYLAVRNQAMQVLNFATALGNGNRAGVAIENRQFNYQNWALLWKIGIATQFEGWDLGVTVTTPRVGFAGSGGTGYDSTAVGQDINQNGEPITEVATNTQMGISSDFESPFSIAVGGAYGLGATRLHLTTEWFAPIDEFVLLDSQPFIGQTSGEPIDTQVTRALTDVLNVAVGVEHELSEKTTLYGSFRTDFSGIDTDSRAPVPLADWDIYHVAGGATLTLGRSEFTVGAILARGDTTTSRVFDPPGDVSLPGENQVKLEYFRLSFILGFNFAFN